MPFSEKRIMDQRRDLVRMWMTGEVSKQSLSEHFGVSRPTVDKWLRRYHSQGEVGLHNRSTRPRSSPGRLEQAIEHRILELRDAVPQWGSKKIHALLERELGVDHVPCRSTVSKVLKRNNRISEHASNRSKPWQRFEYDRPNELWQMDFKGHFGLTNDQRCHPLTILDDHSRYSIGLTACANETRPTVEQCLIQVFNKYGLPDTILTDNGAPWGAANNQPQYSERSYTQLEVWLMQHGIKMIHGKPYHPQTQGKDERFHRTMEDELLRWESFSSLNHCQKAFDSFRDRYNNQRPHEGINMSFPSERYEPSRRRFNPKIKKPQYPVGVELRTVYNTGQISY